MQGYPSICKQTPTRAVKLSSGDASLEAAESLYEDMKHDRPHMAVRLSKLMPKVSVDDRRWCADIVAERIHIWALKAFPGSSTEYVAVMWFELVSPRTKKEHGSSGSSSSSNATLISSTDGTTAHIEVLWTNPKYRQYGFGTQLVQSVLVRYPNISKWTAFTSRDMKKDAGVHKFWKKNGFVQESLEIGNVNQDGFFIRNAEIQTSKRRRIPTQPFKIFEDDLIESQGTNSRKRKEI
jgi:hypothetical protein